MWLAKHMHIQQLWHELQSTLECSSQWGDQPLGIVRLYMSCVQFSLARAGCTYTWCLGLGIVQASCCYGADAAVRWCEAKTPSLARQLVGLENQTAVSAEGR